MKHLLLVSFLPSDAQIIWLQVALICPPHKWNTEQFSHIRGWNVKNGELSKLQIFRTETKSFSKQIKFIFYSGKETEKW